MDTEVPLDFSKDDEEEPEDEFKTGFEKFLGGKWVKKAPTTPGHYFIADREGDIRGVAVLFKSLSTGVLLAMIPGQQSGPAHSVWKGWFWSRRLPDMRLPPDWDEEK